MTLMKRLYGATWPSVRDAFAAFSHPLEGTVPWFYLDVKSLVTVAQGSLEDPLSEATLSLPFVHASDGSPATPAEIADEWHRIKGHTELAQQGAMAAKQWCKLRLTPDGIEALTLRKFDSFAEILASKYDRFSLWQADAQLACMSMAWACGPYWGGIFKTLEQACIDEDWVKASENCEINSKGNPGVVPRSKAQRVLFLNAANSVKLGLDASELLWNAPQPPEAA